LIAPGHISSPPLIATITIAFTSFIDPKRIIMNSDSPLGTVTFVSPLIPEWEYECKVEEDKVQVEPRSVVKVPAYLKAYVEAPTEIEYQILALEYPFLFSRTRSHDDL
jgi:hypothetical protein